MLYYRFDGWFCILKELFIVYMSKIEGIFSVYTLINERKYLYGFISRQEIKEWTISYFYNLYHSFHE